MIAEHELIEQMECDELGWSLERVCDFLLSLEKERPFEVLRAMWRASYIELVDAEGARLPEWRCEEVWRLEDKSAAVRIVGTDAGSDWVSNG